MALKIELKPLLTKYLKAVRCKEHGTSPKIVFSSNNKTWQATNSCCDTFNKQLAAASEKAIVEFTKSNMADFAKRLGKR
jgi:hypothetical protein